MFMWQLVPCPNRLLARCSSRVYKESSLASYVFKSVRRVLVAVAIVFMFDECVHTLDLQHDRMLCRELTCALEDSVEGALAAVWKRMSV